MVKSKGCCRDWIDQKEEERKIWKEFKDGLERTLKEEYLKNEFKKDMKAFLNAMESARSLIVDLEEKIEGFKDDLYEMDYEEAYSALYELEEGYSFLGERVEDVVYFAEKMMEKEWKDFILPDEDERLDEIHERIMTLTKEQFSLMLKILTTRYRNIGMFLEFTDLEVKMKKDTY